MGRIAVSFYETNVGTAKKKLVLAQIPGAVDSTYPRADLDLGEATSLSAYINRLEQLAIFAAVQNGVDHEVIATPHIPVKFVDAPKLDENEIPASVV
jgi:hypothetical protein